MDIVFSLRFIHLGTRCFFSGRSANCLWITLCWSSAWLSLTPSWWMYPVSCLRLARSHRRSEGRMIREQLAAESRPVPGGVLKINLYGEAPPRGPTPYPFIYHFFRKGTPFVHLLLEKGTPFIYLLKKTCENIVQTGSLLVIFFM